VNILWLSHLVPYPPRSGVAQRSYGLLAELCKRHTVTLLAFHQPTLMDSMSQSPDVELQAAVAHLERLCSRVEVFAIPWERSAVHRYALAARSLLSSRPYTINWLTSARFSQALASERGRRHDLVHFDTISLAIYRDSLGDVPCVMNHHNIESQLLDRRARSSGSFARRAYDWQEAVRLRRYERRTAGRFALHVTCSELDRQRFLTIAPDANCCVVPNGVDIEYFAPRPRSVPEPTFVFCGTLGWGPNRLAAERIAKEIWPALAHEWPQSRLFLVGAQPPEIARALAARDERFVVTGFVDDVRPYIAAASFFLCPIREGGGTKLKILNAMSMAAVVVADRVACEGIRAEPEREVLLAASAPDYVAAVRRLLADPARHRQIGAAAHRRVATEYSYEVIGRDMDLKYRAVRAAFATGG
jgi:glycosyltransferase involved in cell wall biosynthesis